MGVAHCKVFKHMFIFVARVCSLRGISRWGMEEIMIFFVQAEEKYRLSNTYRDDIERHYCIFCMLLGSFDVGIDWEGINEHYNYYTQAS
jgi:hypothetical protein